MATHQYQRTDEDEKKLSTPTMSRSRNQLAAAYAPGAFFTFEGGLGSCIAVPDQSDAVDLAAIQEPTKEQIVLRLREVWQSWFTRAYSLNGGGREIDPRQCVDDMLLRDRTYASFAIVRCRVTGHFEPKARLANAKCWA